MSNSISRLDVGLKLDAEPTIYADDGVAIKIGLEVSSVAQQVTIKSGTMACRIAPTPALPLASCCSKRSGYGRRERRGRTTNQRTHLSTLVEQGATCRVIVGVSEQLSERRRQTGT